MNDPTILFFGYGSEYSLHPLFDFMSKRGDRCVEIDMLTEQDCVGRLQDLIGQPLVFVTSAHPLYDQRNFFYYKTERRVVSALHIIATLRPKLSVFYPHDYKDPIKEEEVNYLPQFDLLLWPFDEVPVSYRRLVQTVPVGWIKNPLGAEEIHSVDGKAVFFLGAFQYYLHAGIESFYDDFAEMLGSGVAVKLPRWHDSEKFEAFLRARDVDVYPSDENSVEIIKSCEIVITHALSSVGMEACHLGRKVIYLRDRRFDYKDPLLEFGAAGNISYVNSPSAVATVRAAGLVPNRYSMAEFNFPAVREHILSEYKKRWER